MTKKEKERIELDLLKMEAIKQIRQSMDRYLIENAKREAKAWKFTMINTVVCFCVLLIVILIKCIFSFIK